MSRRDASLVAGLLAATMLACGGASPAPPAADEELPLGATSPTPMTPAAVERLVDTGRFLAGLDGETPVAVAAAVRERHAAELEAAWSRLERERLGPMRAWAARELAASEPRDDGGTVFYPFGGPDAIGALTFFPDASTYVLVGLESPGEIVLGERPAAERRELAGPAAELDADLTELRGSLTSLVDNGYFVTQRMRSDFAGGSLEGVLPVILVLLARSGFEPTGAWYLRLDAEGLPRYAPPEPAPPGGVRVDFRRSDGGDDRLRSLFFLSQDLGDEALATAPGFVSHLRRLGPLDTLVKAAHYLLQGEGFATLAGLVVERSRSILQDDSGLPIRALDPASWSIRVFGRYTAEMPAAYRSTFQPELARLFARPGVEPLPFTLGYHAEVGGGALILARKTAR